MSESSVRICGASMGGYGEYAELPKSEGVIDVIVPIGMVSGYSIRDLNSPECRRKLAVALLGEDSS